MCYELLTGSTPFGVEQSDADADPMEIVRNILQRDVPFPEHYHHFGRLKNLYTGQCLYHEGNPDGSLILAVFRDCEGPTDRPQEGRESVSWYLTKGEEREGQLRHEAEYGSRCLHAHNVKKNARLSLTRCYDNEFPDERLRWTMNEDTQQIYLHSKHLVASRVTCSSRAAQLTRIRALLR